ncbi:battenin-like [Planococcus citri]|uniref:battenin-like n=1 Tax=Planococcus citri TaxID=170843 RepID=UPI0031F94DFE
MIPIKRCALAYWLLGLCNNYGYVVMLSAAHDILARHDGKTETTSDTSFNPDRHCNQLSTGVILLADIIPSLLVKIIAPFLPLWMNIRITLVVISAALGFILVGLSDSLLLAVLGVVCTAFSSGLGESSLLSFTVFFNDKSVLSGWSSGTGGAGFFGSLTYAGLLMLGLTPRETLFLLLVVPLTMAVSFWLILVNPLNTRMEPEESTHVAPPSLNNIPQTISNHSLWYKINAIPRSLRYILPLTFVYYFEYLINQGLSELCLFEKAFIDPKTQYRWYQVFYQIGVFASRSSISIIQIDKLWILAALQGVNLVYFGLEAIYRFTPSVIIVLVVILWEGALGGLGYVNTFHNIQKEVRPEDKETVTGITSISDSLGITFSGFSAIPLHDTICKLPL